MNDETRASIEQAIRDLRPFTWIAWRYDVTYAVVHHRMRPQPLQWPEAISLADAESARAAIAELGDDD